MNERAAVNGFAAIFYKVEGSAPSLSFCTVFACITMLGILIPVVYDCGKKQWKGAKRHWGGDRI